jgi:hypothetical protein
MSSATSVPEFIDLLVFAKTSPKRSHIENKLCMYYHRTVVLYILYKLIHKYISFTSKCISGVKRIKVSSPSAICADWNAVAVATSPPAAAVDHWGGWGGGGGSHHRVRRVATAAFWRTSSHEGKISPGW